MRTEVPTRAPQTQRTATPRLRCDQGAPVQRWEIVALAGVLLVFVVLGLRLALTGVPLGSDEAVYALRARHFLQGVDPGVYWRDLRAPGLPLLLTPVLGAGGGVGEMRAAVLCMGAAGIVLTWALGRRWSSPIVGVLGAGALAVTPVYIVSSAQLTPDVPGAVAGVAAVLLYHESLVRQRWLAWPAVAVGVVATAVRYGAPMSLAAGFGLVALAHWGIVRRRLWHETLVALVLAAAIAVIQFVPAVTGADRAPFLDNEELNSEKYVPLQAFRDFGEQLPPALGTVVLIVCLVGACGLLVALSRRAPEAPGAALATGIGLVTFLFLAVSLNHGEPRYLVPVVPFLLLGLVGGFTVLIRSGPTAAALTGALVVAGALVAAPLSASTMNRLAKVGPMRQAAVEVGERTYGDCWIITSYVPEVQWYSGCETTPFQSPAPASLREHMEGMSADQPVYALFGTQGKRQPEGPDLEAYMSMLDGPVLETGDPDSDQLVRHIEVYQEDR